MTGPAAQAPRPGHRLTNWPEEWLNMLAPAQSHHIPTRRPMNTWPFPLAACCALALVAGCASVPAPQAPQDTTKFTVENTGRFVALDAPTEAAISCTGLQERALADGRLEVVANLKNSDAKPVKVNVQCVFFDEQGLPVGGESKWELLPISADATEVVRFTAPVLVARKYSIRVRSAR
jgi:hypothetical protein